MAERTQQKLELFSQIGNRLKAAREAHGYTLQELSAHTRINLLFLQKIETGDLAGLPGLAFVKGFIRNYIQVLQINDPELEEELKNLSPQEGPDSAAHIRPSNPYVLETETPTVSYWRIGLFVGLAVLILWVGYVLLIGSNEPSVATPEPTPAAPAAAVSTASEAPPTPLPGSGQGMVAQPGASAPAVNSSGPPGPALNPAPAATAPSGSARATPPPAANRPGAAAPPRGAATGAPLEGRQKLELTLRGIEPTWVRLSIDRAPPVDVRVQPSETVAWEANQEIRLTIGKSQGVAVYLNGEEVLLPQEQNKLIPNLVLNKLTLLRLEN